MQECNSDLEEKKWHEERQESMSLENILGVQETYGCSECPLVFDKAIDRFNHLNTVHCLTNRDLSCAVCNMKFKKTQDLKNHNLEHQDGSGNYACDICGKVVKTTTSLRKTSDFHMSNP